MANTNTSIRFSADGLEQIKNDAGELMRSMLRENEKYNVSSKETINIIKERLRVNKLLGDTDIQIQKAQLKESLDKGLISEDSYKQSMSLIGQDKTTNDIFSKYLEGILYELKIIRESGGEDVEAIDRLSRSLSLTEDDQEELDSLLNKVKEEQRKPSELSEDEKDPQKSTMGRFALSNLLNAIDNPDPGQSMANLTSNVGSAMMMAGKGGIWGLVLAGVGEIASSAMDELQKAEEAARQNIQLTGGNLRNFYKDDTYQEFDKYSSYGYSLPELYLKNASFARDRGENMGIDNTGNLALFQKAYGIDDGVMSSLQQSLRGNNKEFYDSNLIRLVLQSMKASGMAEDGDYSYLNEYMSTLTSISQQQLTAIGETNVWRNNVLLQSIAAVGDKFENPQVLQGVVQGIIGGLSNPSSMQVEALQFDALANLRPDASLWELEKIRENPTDNPEYLTEFMSRLREMSGGEVELMARNFSEVFFGGAKKQISEDLVTAYLEGGDFNSQLDKAFRKTKDITNEEIRDRAIQSTTSEEVRTATAENVKQATVASLNENIESLLNYQSSANREMNDLNKNLEDTNKNIDKLRRERKLK